MREVIRQYGLMVVAAVGAILFLGIAGNLLLAPDGLIARVVMFWGNGGC